jgi:hypothetical protein
MTSLKDSLSPLYQSNFNPPSLLVYLNSTIIVVVPLLLLTRPALAILSALASLSGIRPAFTHA